MSGIFQRNEIQARIAVSCMKDLHLSVEHRSLHEDFMEQGKLDRLCRIQYTNDCCECLRERVNEVGEKLLHLMKSMGW